MKRIDRSLVEGDKWGLYKNQDIIPMWIADTDFRAPKEIIDALHARVEHGVFGYTDVDAKTDQAVIDFIKRQHNWQIKKDSWTIDFDEFEKAITSTCKLFMFCNPYNLGGTVFTKEELESLSEICIKHDLIVCSDEIHADLILNPEVKHIPIASLNSEILKRSITLHAPSKTFNIESKI